MPPSRWPSSTLNHLTADRNRTCPLNLPRPPGGCLSPPALPTSATGTSHRAVRAIDVVAGLTAFGRERGEGGPKLTSHSFTYIIPAKDEGLHLHTAFDELRKRLDQYPDSGVVIVDNGSSAHNRDVFARLSQCNSRNDSSNLFISIPAAGYGRAVKQAVHDQCPGKNDENRYLVITALDLPFGFSDLDRVISESRFGSQDTIFIGSKDHPESVIRRPLARRVLSWLFQLTRRVLFSSSIGDTQGSLFVPARMAQRIIPSVKADDFFFSTELLLRAEREKAVIVEVPVRLSADKRKSRVSVLRDGTSMLYQLFRLWFQIR
jgi:dolichyl-phosphate beta-glucosyltransferase